MKKLMLDSNMLCDYPKKKQDIIKIATILFNEQGFPIGVDTIIEQSNVAKMTFYKYFPSKQDLIETCLKEEVLNRQQMIQDWMAKHEKGGLEGVLGWLEYWISDKNFHGCLLIKATLNFPKDETIHSLAQGYQRWLVHTISTLLIANHQISSKQANLLSEQVFLLLQGATVQQLVDKQAVSLTMNLIHDLIGISMAGETRYVE